MSTKDALGPFQAGDGGLPPYLAGREYEQEICGAFLSRLRNDRPPPREILFHGPRGNGKTALLAWFRKESVSLRLPVQMAAQHQAVLGTVIVGGLVSVSFKTHAPVRR